MNLSNALNTANATHQKGDLDQAKEQYLAIIESSDNNDAIYGLATILCQKKQYLQAIPLFEKIQVREPHAFDIALNYALCLKAAGKNEIAIIVVNKIIAHIPNEISVIMAFGQLSFSLKEFQLAIKILTLYPYSAVEVNILLANAYFQAEQWKCAQKAYLNLAKLTPENAMLWQNAAFSSAKIRDYPSAISAFSHFITSSPKISTNHLKFADLYLLAKETDKAEEQLNLAILLKDNSVTRYELEARINLLNNKYPEAIVAANFLISIDNNNATGWKIKSELERDSKKCISHLGYLLSEESEENYQNQKNLYTLAKAFESEKNYSKAFECFDKANLMQGNQLAKLNLTFSPSKIAKEHINFAKILVKPQKNKQVNGSIKPQNIFIVGMPRSGTTLVDRLLSQVKNVKSSGENEALAFAVEQKIKQHFSMPTLDWEHFLKTNASSFENSYKKATQVNSDIIVDKMPHNFRYVGTIISTFKDVRIVQMRRNPQDLALSIFSQPFALEHNYATSLSAIAHAIYHANKLMDFWAQTYPNQVINIEYEKLARKPNEIAEKLFNFCELEWQQEYLGFFQKSVSSFTFSELQVRQAINTKKINFSNNYKHQLTEFNETYNTLVLKDNKN